MKFTTGTAVEHSRFGQGTITAIAADGAVTVDFGICGIIEIAGEEYLCPAGTAERLRRGKNRAQREQRRVYLHFLTHSDDAPEHIKAIRGSPHFMHYLQWLEHDLLLDTATYAGLRTAHRPILWRAIERYFDHYTHFLRLEIEAMGAGLSRIPFPGSLALSTCGTTEPSELGAPAWLDAAFRQWNDYLDGSIGPAASRPPPDWGKADAWGLALAKHLKTHTDPRIYVEYRPFREIRLIQGKPVELNVPHALRRYLARPPEGPC